MKTKLVLFVLLCLMCIATAWAQDPQRKIIYQKSTSLLPATYIMKFSLYDVSTGGNPVWHEDDKSINLTSTSTISTFLGSKTPLDPAFFTKQLWVQVEDCTTSCVVVGTRDRLSMVPYAMWSESGGGVSSIVAGNGLTASSTTGNVVLNVGAGTGITVGADTISVNTTVIQNRVTGSCPAGSAIRAIDSTGAVVTCQTDTNSDGTITGVTAGTGLSGGGTSGTVALDVNFAGSGGAATASRSDHSHDIQALIKAYTGQGGISSSPLKSDLGVYFAGPTVSINITSGQVIHVTANQAFGSLSPLGASNLDLAICSKSSAGSVIPYGAFVSGLTASSSQRNTYGLSYVISGLSAGIYSVGLCYKTNNTFWNNNGSGYVSALVF